MPYFSDISFLNGGPLPLPPIDPIPDPPVNLMAESSSTEHKVSCQAQDQEHQHQGGVAEQEVYVGEDLHEAHGQSGQIQFANRSI